MLRNSVLAVALAVALCGFSRPAAAQYATSPQAHPLAITAGWMFPQGDLPDDNDFTAGLQYTFSGYGQSPRNQLFLSADWLQLDSNQFAGGIFTTRSVTLVPVLLNYRLHFGGGPLYAFAGAGVLYADKDVPEMDISNQWNFAWQAGLGYDFGDRWFVQGKFLAGDSPGDDGMWAAQLGFRL